MAITTCQHCGSLTPATVVRCARCGAPLGSFPPAAAPGGYPPQGSGWGTPQIEHPDAITVLVLGILGLVACALCAPFAWSKGNNALRQIDANPGRYSNRGTVQAGRILGIVGSCIIGLWLVGAIVAIIMVTFLGTAATTVDSNTRQACATQRRTLQTAVAAYNAQNGRYPASESDLVPDYLTEESADFDLAGGSATAAPDIVPDGPRCD